MIRADGNGGSQDVDLVLGDDLGDVTEEAGSIIGLDTHRDRVGLGRHGFPFDFDQTSDLALVDDRWARAKVNGHALSAGDESLDRITRDGMTAPGEPDEQVPYPLDADATRLGRGHRRRDRRKLELGVVNDPQARDDRLGTDGSVADRGQEIVNLIVVQLSRDLSEAVVANGRERRPGEAPQLAFQGLAPMDDVLVPLLALEPLPDLLPGVTGPDKIEPVT